MFKTLALCVIGSASIAACSSAAPRPDTRSAANAACPTYSTGSHLPSKPGQCSSNAVRSYSQEDVERTGQTDVGSALRMLDPSITTHQ